MIADVKQSKGAGQGKTAPDKSLLELKQHPQFVEDVVHVTACSCNRCLSASEPLIRRHLVVFPCFAPDAQPCA